MSYKQLYSDRSYIKSQIKALRLLCAQHSTTIRQIETIRRKISEYERELRTLNFAYTVSSSLSKAIVQLDSDMNVVSIYPSLTIAAEQTGLTASNISRAAIKKNGRKQAGGYYWKYQLTQHQNAAV